MKGGKAERRREASRKDIRQKKGKVETREKDCVLHGEGYTLSANEDDSFGIVHEVTTSRRIWIICVSGVYYLFHIIDCVIPSSNHSLPDKSATMKVLMAIALMT